MPEERSFRALVYLRKYSTEVPRTPDMVYSCESVDTEGGALWIDISKDESVIIPLDLVERVKLSRN